jgi:hypothetical protein
MSKPLFAALLGGFLGIFDGLSALVSAPETAPEIAGIVIGSTFKGLLTGVLIGWFALRTRSLGKGIAFGLACGLFFAFLTALAQQMTDGRNYYWQIMLPGGVLGMIVGYATYKYGGRNEPTAAHDRAS